MKKPLNVKWALISIATFSLLQAPIPLSAAEGPTQAVQLDKKPIRSSSGRRGAGPTKKLEDDVIVSPLQACKGVVIASGKAYEQNKERWQQWEKDCNNGKSIQVTNIDSLTEAPMYMDFARSVTERTIQVLDNNRKFLACNQDCFSGKAQSCDVEEAGKKVTYVCEDQKKAVARQLQGLSLRARMELALSGGHLGYADSGATYIHNLAEDKRINSKLASTSFLHPNPFEGSALTERELTRIKRVLRQDKESVEAEWDSVKGKTRNDIQGSFLGNKSRQKMEEHQVKYARLVYEEVPILAVIDKPKSYEDDGRPNWNDDQLAAAFGKLVDNVDRAKARAQRALERGKLDFGFFERAGRGTAELVKAMDEENDLVYYMNFRGVVEDLLKKDPSKCGVATAMLERIGEKNLHNTLGITAAVAGTTMALGPLLGAAGYSGAAAFLSTAPGLLSSGMVFGGGLALNELRKSFSIEAESSTRSGLGGQEDIPLRKVEDIEESQSAFLTSAVFSIATPGAIGTAKGAITALDKYLVGKALRGDFAKVGVDKALSDRMVKLATSSDATTKTAAREEAKKFIELAKSKGLASEDPRLVDVAARMEKEGVSDPQLLDHLSRTASALEGQERDRMYKRVLSLWEKSLPSRANREEKKAALEAITALGRLGYKSEDEMVKLLKDLNWGPDSLKGVAAVVDQAADLFRQASKGVTDVAKLDALRSQAVRDAYALKVYGMTEAQIRAQLQGVNANASQIQAGIEAAGLPRGARQTAAVEGNAREARERLQRQLDDINASCACVAMCPRTKGGKVSAISTDGLFAENGTGVYLACTTSNKDQLAQF